MSSMHDQDFSQIPRWRQWVVQWDISHNAISLAFFAFTSMWQSASTQFNEMVTVPKEIWYSLYTISCMILTVAALLFLARAVLYPSAIVADFNHPRLVNFFYMPVMIGALCVLTTPTSLRTLAQFKAGFYVLSTYQLGLTLYLYGEWLFGAHPTTFIHPLVFMQTIGFFLCAIVGANAHLVDQATAMFSIGCLFWLLVFVTNFQHVALALDKHSERPQPTFFLFIAPPAQAAAAAYVIQAANSVDENLKGSLLVLPKGSEWPELAQFFHYVDMFIYLLMFRLFPTFWTSRFTVSWWAYIFPLSAAAGTTIWRYRVEKKLFWGILAAFLSVVACTAMVVVSCFTIWALATKRVPSNRSALSSYHRYYTRGNQADVEANR